MSLRVLHKNIRKEIEKNYNVIDYIDLYRYCHNSNFEKLAEDLLSVFSVHRTQRRKFKFNIVKI
jgi:hypothetical protein